MTYEQWVAQCAAAYLAAGMEEATAKEAAQANADMQQELVGAFIEGSWPEPDAAASEDISNW